MKKIIIFIVMMFIGMVASAQIKDTGKNYEMHIGKYVLSADDGISYELAKKMSKGHYGIFEYRADNAEEVYALGKFIDANKKRIESRFDIIIEDYCYGKIKEKDYRVTVLAYSTAAWKRLQEIKAQKENEKMERINSLKDF